MSMDDLTIMYYDTTEGLVEALYDKEASWHGADNNIDIMKLNWYSECESLIQPFKTIAKWVPNAKIFISLAITAQGSTVVVRIWRL